jgi:NB-ARC domain
MEANPGDARSAFARRAYLANPHSLWGPATGLATVIDLCGHDCRNHHQAVADRLSSLVLADLERPVGITSAKQTTALHGMGGIGKSVLATAFARSTKARHAFGDGIVWIRVGLGAEPLSCIRQL